MVKIVEDESGWSHGPDGLSVPESGLVATNTHDARALDLHVGPVRVYVHPLFWGLTRLPPLHLTEGPGPWLSRGQMWEDEHPYREADPVLVVRLPLVRRALVFGFWGMPDTDRTLPGFMAYTAAPDQYPISEWQRPDETTEVEGTAYEDTPGVVVVCPTDPRQTPIDEDEDDGLGDLNVVRNVPWGGERA